MVSLMGIPPLLLQGRVLAILDRCRADTALPRGVEQCGMVAELDAHQVNKRVNEKVPVFYRRHYHRPHFYN